ncbi:two-component system sensor histidine kinase [Arcobacter venerupis]|uniref:histidine kinase n=1 Tax=Arcobacter venerupis TaxID=1054033 RepID=A0AAE7E5M0_9BACT|nr:ArsS family sensor histidine kinase [Arcobacter venerupis]QKF68604.1 two-component system sensor histidine kinase [Arcobacter venerupis]RWS48699.1 histidine kinase [Arcobacter venerupis]
MSIFKKISILFIISLTLMSIIGFWIDNINSKRVDSLVKEKYIKISNELFENIENKSLLDKLIKIYDLEYKKSIKKEKDYEVLYDNRLTFGNIIILKKSFDDEFIIKIKYLDDEYILESPDEKNIIDKLILNILVFTDIFVLILIFLYLIKLLSPLKVITKQLTNFANGDLSSRLDISSKDEIGVLAITFNKMANSLENSIKTREELLRDIGHELRTPIAKGKFAIEKIDDFSQKELLKKIFFDLEILTNELIELEKLDLTKLNLTNFTAETLIVESLGKLYLEDESKIDINIVDNFKILGDLHYLSVALKNLIDNALKYAISFPIIIEVNKKEILISNKGKKLSKEIEYYLKPFTQELSQRDGFGLGLSIVKKIIDKHNFKLDYSYENEFNTFKIYLLIP